LGRERRWGRRRRLVATVGGGVLVLVLGVWFVIIPYPRGLGEGDPAPTSLMTQRLREARAAGDSLVVRHSWVPLDEISPNLARAVIVAEDYRFRQHEGIDWVSLADEVEWTGDEHFSWWSSADLGALARALLYGWSHRDELRGRSTITQQLAKNLYFGTDRSLLRKAMEALVARRLERRLTKDRILELYLNIVEWGPGIFGAEAAARVYFDSPASRLSLDEAAALAGTLPHPLTSNPGHRPSRMLWRKRLILERLGGGLPTAPMPLPEPDIGDFLTEPDLEFPPVGDSLTADTIAGDSTTRTDTIRTDTIRTDTIRADTIRADTIGVDIIRSDTINRTDTIRTDGRM